MGMQLKREGPSDAPGLDTCTLLGPSRPSSHPSAYDRNLHECRPGATPLRAIGLRPPPLARYLADSNGHERARGIVPYLLIMLSANSRLPGRTNRASLILSVAHLWHGLHNGTLLSCSFQSLGRCDLGSISWMQTAGAVMQHPHLFWNRANNCSSKSRGSVAWVIVCAARRLALTGLCLPLSNAGSNELPDGSEDCQSG